MPTLPSSRCFDQTLISRLLRQPTQICARSALPATLLEVRGLCAALDDTLIRVRLHRRLPVDRVPDILGDDRRTARLLEHIAFSQLRRPSKRSSCNCRTPPCNVAIPTHHDNRTDTIACFILNRYSVFLPDRKRSCRRGILSKSVACSGPPRWSIKSRRSLKFLTFSLPFPALPTLSLEIPLPKQDFFG